jgi:dTDP-4-dehydrorhamnose 3,5-epimerase-like enzyme
MKKGKSCVLKGFKNLKCSYGTVDAKNFKSLYLNIQTWAEPKIGIKWLLDNPILSERDKNTPLL